MFWHQERLVQQRPGGDALEAFFLCVMLGFRGNLRNHPTKLRAWFDATQARIISGLGQGIFDPNSIPADSVPSHVPARRNRERFRQMVLIWGATLLASVFLLALFLTFYWGR
jgi:type VI secretion system protein ImpK